MRFIHIGHDSFRPESFEQVTNGANPLKPAHGFWACPVDGEDEDESEWMDFCEREDIPLDKSKTFTFTIKEGARVLVLSTRGLLDLPSRYGRTDAPFNIDWSKIAKDYDVIVSAMSYEDLHNTGWDVPSICVCNPDIIIPYNEDV